MIVAFIDRSYNLINLAHRLFKISAFNHPIVLLDDYFYRFETVYLDDEIRVVKDIRGDYLVVDRAPYSWKE